jgi:phosphoribosyl-AMP cyclohydrolase
VVVKALADAEDREHLRVRYAQMSKETHKCQKRPTMEGKETYYGRKRDLLWKEKRPTMGGKETYYGDREHLRVEVRTNVKRDPQMSNRPTMEGKETYYGRKRDLWEEKRPTMEGKETYYGRKRDLL